MVRWNSSRHPISDIRDWSNAGLLELQPDFQRREVWSAPARIMLMDTVLRDVPMPKIFLANRVRDDRTHRVVIDGQQRIRATLDFLRDRFSLDEPYGGTEKGKKFSELDQDTKDRFLSYQIDFNEAVNPTDEEVRDVYARVNKYVVALNKQELRRADFPGDFLTVSEELAMNPYLEDARIFTPVNRRRYADVEYTSELLAAIIDGVQDRKLTLDDFYMRYSEWNVEHRERIENMFIKILDELKVIFSDDFNISETRFQQKADFYTLFHVVGEFLSDGYSICDKNVDPLRDDLKWLDDEIRPESRISACREYAVKCVSQANSASSRRWRSRFLKSILAGTYVGRQIDSNGDLLLYNLMEEKIANLDVGLCPVPDDPDDPIITCYACGNDIEDDLKSCVLAWPRSEREHQLSNSEWFHMSCMKENDCWGGWSFLGRPNDGQSDLF